MSENEKTVENMYAAFASGDVPSVLAAFDENIEWREAENFPYADGNPYRGPQAIAEGVFQRLGADWRYWNLQVDEIHGAGDTVVACGRYKAENKKTGRAIDAQFAHVWTIKNGRAAKFQQYADTLQVAAAMKS